MTAKIILLNGAPQSGKDTLAHYLEKELKAKHLKYAANVREVAGIIHPKVNFWDETIKDIALECLSFQTPREVLIKIGMSLRTGLDKNVWVESLAEKIEAEYWGKTVAVISDCGFQNEVDVMIQRFGEQNVLLVQVYRDGYTFENDCRNYVDGYCSFITLYNQDKAKFQVEGLQAVTKWLSYTTPRSKQAA